jgi:hypothetical protein
VLHAVANPSIEVPVAEVLEDAEVARVEMSRKVGHVNRDFNVHSSTSFTYGINPSASNSLMRLSVSYQEQSSAARVR